MRCAPCDAHARTAARGRGEMVDARDLKSLGAKALCRFESGRPHQLPPMEEADVTVFAVAVTGAAGQVAPHGSEDPNQIRREIADLDSRRFAVGRSTPSFDLHHAGRFALHEDNL